MGSDKDISPAPMGSDEQFSELMTLLEASWKNKGVVKTEQGNDLTFSFKVTEDGPLANLYALAKGMEA